MRTPSGVVEQAIAARRLGDQQRGWAVGLWQQQCALFTPDARRHVRGSAP